MRKFESGATRDDNEDKPVFDKFLSHEVLRCYAAYMHENRYQADGKVRNGDNWKRGIDESAYMESLFRHFMDVWEAHEMSDRSKLTESLNAVLFNAMGFQYENLKRVNQQIEEIDKRLESFAFDQDSPTMEDLTGYERRSMGFD